MELLSGFSVFVSAVVLLVFSVKSSCYHLKDGAFYKLDPTWPIDMEAFKGPVYSAAIDDDNGEVYVSQRGDGIPHVLVFDLEVGRLLRSFTYNDSSMLQDLHGMRYQFNETNQQGYIWVTDVGDGVHGHTVKRLLPNGTVDLTMGVAGKSGTSLHPLMFGDVADIAINAEGVLYIADGDGGVNNRVVKVELRNSGTLAMWSIGGNGSSPGQFHIPHSVELDEGGRLWVADRMNGRLEAFDAKTGELLGIWSSCFKDGEPYSVRLSKDKGHFIVTQLNSDQIVLVKAAPGSGPIGDCHRLDTITLGKDTKPHLVAVSKSTGAFFVGELGTQACQKFVPIS
ncbi:NHL repeat-containing protein 3 [Strongylocentrotus purpuratus]|uniref:Peptidylamidoglycolate lyase n=1 Tax=Strongylocentrotus purpuratus TaxID=7668 RepID=A0A7M7NM60_STRPU|nr:NHL repeat-containing protein 3 [Strongylocentrotus purpuratus]